MSHEREVEDLIVVRHEIACAMRVMMKSNDTLRSFQMREAELLRIIEGRE